MTVEGQPSIRGRDAIRKHLQSFADFRVQSETLTADAIAVDGPRGHVTGTYRQRVRVPAGDVVEVHGTYSADWVRDPQGAWHIQRMLTVPQR